MTSALLVVIAGTGTGVGKSSVASAIVRAWGARCRVAGYKPVETGVTGEEGEDARVLREASSFHVKPSPHAWVFRPAISPHLAAREAGVALDLTAMADEISRLRACLDGLVVELAGGLFTPLGPRSLNLDLVRATHPTSLLLVAPDRLGVLHDVGATTAAAAAAGIDISGVLLNAPAETDASTGRNADELPMVTHVPLLAALPRTTPDALAQHPAIQRVIDTFTRG
jgi:dethiobiotin synthetase